MTRPPADPSDNSSTEPPTPDPSEGGEFSYVQRNVVLTAVSLLLLFVGVGVLGIFFEERLLDATSAIYDVLGLPGLLAILFVSDAVISPVPPDGVLIVLANSPAHAIWTYLIPAIGLMSAAAGHIGWKLGGLLRHTRSLQVVFARSSSKNTDFVKRYGGWGVALGALTPVPFSITCWAAGIVQVPYKQFWWATLLRIPRYVLFYAAIAYSTEILSALS